MGKSTLKLPFISTPNFPLNRILLARLAASIAVVLMVIAAVEFRPESEHLIRPFWVMVAGGAALGLALWLHPQAGIPQSLQSIDAAITRRVRWLPFGTGIGLLVVLSLRSGKDILLPVLNDLTPVYVQALILFAGISLIIVGAGGLRWSDFAMIPAWLRAHRWELLLVGGVLLLAFSVRVYTLENNMRAFMDEGPFMNATLLMRSEPRTPLIGPMHDIATFTRLFAFGELLLTDLLGSTLAIFRLAPALYGTFTIGVTYGLTRQLFDKWTAIIAAVLLAFLPPHVHFSRIGINNIADPLFGVLALLFLFRALQTRQRLHYVLAGVVVGLLPYFYEGGELLYPPLLMLWTVWLAIAGKLRASWRGLFWMGLVALLIALPVYYTNSTYDLALFTRLDQRNIGNDYWLSVLVSPNGLRSLSNYFNDRLLPPLLHYIHAPDASEFYGGQTPLILTPLLPLGLLGLFHALWRPRVGGALLVFWVLLTALGNSLIYYNNWTVRFVVVMPAIAILLAVGLRYTLPMLLPRGHGRIFAAMLVICAIGQTLYYFGPHMTIYRQQILYLRRHYDVVYRVRLLPENVEVFQIYDYYVLTPWSYVFLKFQGDDHVFEARRMANINLVGLDRNQPYAFFVPHDDPAALQGLEAVWALDGPHFAMTEALESQQYALYYTRFRVWNDDEVF